MFFNIISKIFIVIGIVSALTITIDILKHPQKEMPIMNWVWPINGLWAGIFGVWAYFTIGKHRKMDMSGMDMSNMKMDDMKDMDMSNMKMDDMKGMDMSNMKMDDDKYSSFWQGVVADTLHCGAGPQKPKTPKPPNPSILK